MQFSIKQLLLATTFAAVACFTLVYATPFWGCVVFSCSVMLFMLAVLFAIVTHGQRRAMWLGVVVMGWGYWLLMCSPILDTDNMQHRSWRVEGSGPPFATTRLLQVAYFNVLPLVHAEPEFDTQGKRTNKSRFPTEIEFMQVGQSWFSLLFALLGGVVGSRVYARNEAAKKDQPDVA
ncbi:hypothetical protein [Anatilimnocola floriformis]|uniref:hypothetical protein n=1 Tax=Anatilimnocola floriformis TaxID=2948575 RepID=UPI0020C4F0ED|nr:hypothetical protein [Anatilimnocola floriformis]